MSALRLAVDLCAEFEGFRPFPYPDPASPLATAARTPRWGREPATAILAGLPLWQRALSGAPWTQGYGLTGANIKPENQAWSERVARINLEARVEERIEEIQRHNRVVLTTGQLAALACFLDNVGGGAVGKKDGLFCLKKENRPSTLWRLCQTEDHAGAAKQFEKWSSAGGVRLAGLVRRRAAEKRLYETGAWR